MEHGPLVAVPSLTLTAFGVGIAIDWSSTRNGRLSAAGSPAR
jgi:hypothetical protein